MDFDFFKHPSYPYGLKEDLIGKLELTSSEKLVLCSVDTPAAYQLSNVSLEYGAIFDEPYATTIVELYAGATSTPFSKVTLIHCETLSEKDTAWKIDVNNLFSFITRLTVTIP